MNGLDGCLRNPRGNLGFRQEHICVRQIQLAAIYAIGVGRYPMVGITFS
jgi:hypothetical protein